VPCVLASSPRVIFDQYQVAARSDLAKRFPWRRMTIRISRDDCARFRCDARFRFFRRKRSGPVINVGKARRRSQQSNRVNGFPPGMSRSNDFVFRADAACSERHRKADRATRNRDRVPAADVGGEGGFERRCQRTRREPRRLQGLADRFPPGELAGALELDCQAGQRVGEHVVQLAGDAAAFGQRGRGGLGLLRVLELGQQQLGAVLALAAAPDELAKLTLTNLYNKRPTWLVNAHLKLDEAVFAAYGWPATLTDAELLERLLALNHERATAHER